MQISVELVPREKKEFLDELQFIKKNIPQVDVVNIPDLLRFDTRSWTAAQETKPYFKNVIPHLRAIDFDYKKEFCLKEYFLQNEINEVLVINGDVPQDLSRRIYSTTTCKMIERLKKDLPNLKIYAGIDPYRNAVKQEADYIKQKLDAGADGFMTQPYFDLRLVEMYAEQLEGYEVFWGITPVCSERSQGYWTSRNCAFFPKGFEPTLEWNINFGREILEFVEKNDLSLYVMPIRVDLQDYLLKIFNR